jgi:RND family efflux transporter MFP subunit
MPDRNPEHGPDAAKDGGAPTAGSHERSRQEMLAYNAPPGLKKAGIIAICVLAVVAVLGICWRLWERHETRQWTKDQLTQTVGVIQIKSLKAGGQLNLPGQLQAFTNAPIYAQVSGYVQKWFVDIGAPVKQGQLLAQIDPRTYQAALTQARGTLARDTATLNNAKTDLTRYQTLMTQNAISAQQLATQQATVNSDAGVVETDRGQVQQAEINLAYTRIIAPFDGVVTSRSVDVGNLITTGIASATPLFTVSDHTKLRVYVSVPQNFSGAIHDGMTVSFTTPDHPGQVFSAILAASAGAVVQSTNTMLVQFSTDNHEGMLKPGGYASVKLPLPAGSGGTTLPASTLIFRDSGMQVAVVDRQNKVHMKPINILRDNGATVEVAAGAVQGSDRIVDNPPDSLQDGDTVQIAAPAKPQGAAPAKTGNPEQ